MKYLIVFAFALFIIFFSCTSSKEKSGTGFFNRDSLVSQQYTISTDKDTTLKTGNGALIRIPKGALVPENGRTVTLEIKEAYSLIAMMKAGLTTQSNGQPLSSGGMIYINAAGGQTVKITQAINVAIPTDYLSKDMQLYKGEEAKDSNINWTSPQPLPENRQLTSIEKGKALFQSSCSNCHDIGRDLTGPNLAHFKKRFAYGEENNHLWFHTFSNPYVPYRLDSVGEKDFLYEHSWFDPYVCNLVALYGGQIAPPFPGLKFEDWLDTYNYIQNESDRKNLPLPSHAYLDDCVDSCEAYIKEVKELKAKQQEAGLKRKSLIKDNGEMVVITPDSANALPPGAAVNFDDKVSPENYGSVYYQFTIESFGWYNIDVLLKDVNGVEESELFVRIVGQYRQKINLFLIIPSHKVYGEGGPTGRNEDEYAFFLKNGKLPLPQNVKAYVLAVTESEESIAYSLKEFTTGKQQQFDLSLHTATKTEFLSAMQQFDLERLHIKVRDSKNAAEIKKTDTNLKTINEQLKAAEHLKPKGCDCDCAFSEQ